MIKSLILITLLVSLLHGCTQNDVTTGPVEIDRSTSCSLDGMILMDYPGPKAQIHYDSGEPDYFCDTMEMFSIYLRPEQKKRVMSLYSQDMGKTPWEKPTGNWIDARTAYYVYGSKQLGAMGPTLAAFARREDADEFIRRYGGKVFMFEQVTLDMVALDGGAQHDERM